MIFSFLHFDDLSTFYRIKLTREGNKLARSVTDAEEWRSAAAQVVERFFAQITYLPMTNSEHSSAEVTPSRAFIMVNRVLPPVRSLQQFLFVRFHLFATFLPTIRHAKNVHVRTSVRSGINKYFERLSNLCTVQSIQGMLGKKLRNEFCRSEKEISLYLFWRWFFDDTSWHVVQEKKFERSCTTL